jgi:hypothetical protein
MIGLVQSKEITVPKVGKKEFSYTSKGMAMAKKEAKKTGMKMKTGKKAKGRGK